MNKGRDIELPNESGTTDIHRDTEVSTGDAKRPTKTVYYRDSTYPAQRKDESREAFGKRYRLQNPGEAEMARREATKKRSMRGGKR